MKRQTKLGTHLQGVPISEGVAVARVCMFNEQRHSNLPMYHVDADGAEREVRRAQRAVEIGAERLEAIRERVATEIGRPEAEIFAAQRTILEDETLSRKVHRIVRESGVNAEAAILQVLDEYETQLLDIDDEYLKERASDIGEVKRRLLDVLGHMQPSLQCEEWHCQKGEARIIVAEELTPSLTVDLDTRMLRGFVTERGGRSSHAAILARALGIPAVSGIVGIRDIVTCGVELLVDGTAGEIVIWPDQESVERVNGLEDARLRQPIAEPPVADLAVMANISMPGDVDAAQAQQADGIGLYRTEIEFMSWSKAPTEEELFERYAEVRRAMGEKAVLYRAFDIGSDKPVAFLQADDEQNPALGWRGSRLLLGCPELFRTQARALARTSQLGPVDIMYPMIVDIEQYRALRAAFCEATTDIECGEIRHGVMFEVPSACLRAREILGEADFGSVGTNDLLQYLFAADRDNAYVAAAYSPDQPALWDMLQVIAEAGCEQGKPVSVCGEIAGEPRYIPTLLDVGIRAVSVSSRRISAVRKAARKVLAGRETR